MKITDFLYEIVEESSLLLDYQVFCFQGSSFQPTFFSVIFNYLAINKKLPGRYQRFSFSKDGGKEIVQLEGLRLFMLGEKISYWLGDMTARQLSRTVKKELPFFLSGYDGPHYLFLFSDSVQPSSNMLIIDCNTAFSPQLAKTFLLLKGHQFQKTKFDILVQQVKELTPFSLDALCMQVSYFSLIGLKSIHDDVYYLKGLSGSSVQLSSLVEAFFEKNDKRFFELWSYVKADYSEPFWIVFWADTLWRAYHVCYYMHIKQYREAKQMSYRLPFSFINRLWKNISCYKLKEAYQAIYRYDYLFKKGLAKGLVEQFFFSYFSRER